MSTTATATQPKAWRKNKARAYCDCGNPTAAVKFGQHVCQRCYDLDTKTRIWRKD